MFSVRVDQSFTITGWESCYNLASQLQPFGNLTECDVEILSYSVRTELPETVSSHRDQQRWQGFNVLMIIQQQKYALE